jgi:hypothetical protein
MAQLMSSAEQLTGDIDQWFDTIMDRVSQRFAMHTRLWTVLFAIVLAFALQLDAFKLFTTLSSDAELRARVVASADALSKKADEILVTSTNGTSAIGNASDGVKILNGAANNTIGGTASGEGNLISGNANSGVFMRDAGTSGNTVAGNFIGTDITGTILLTVREVGVIIGGEIA